MPRLSDVCQACSGQMLAAPGAPTKITGPSFLLAVRRNAGPRGGLFTLAAGAGHESASPGVEAKRAVRLYRARIVVVEL